jgi:brefeldin A-inhibited guanine nucleotide-exchange protein
VDLFGQFYEPMAPLLPRLLELLRGFIARSHASLASVGVAAYTRMVASCGDKLYSTAWQQVSLCDLKPCAAAAAAATVACSYNSGAV